MSESDDAKKLSELQILGSMYSDDFTLSDPSCLCDLTEAISSGYKYLKSIRLAVKLESFTKNNLEATFDLPSNYPSEQATFSIRCSAVQSRAQSTKLHKDLKSYLISHVATGDCVVVEALLWLVANISEYTHEPTTTIADVKVETDLARYWILSHHIYNTTKRKIIVDTARNLNLRGFSMPGKPGLVCIEGCKESCEEFWQNIKSLTWKKITLKHIEFDLKEKNAEENSHKDTWRKFDKFEEIFFSSSDNSNHGDMGQLQNYLNNHQLPYAFSIFFGIENKI